MTNNSISINNNGSNTAIQNIAQGHDVHVSSGQQLVNNEHNNVFHEAFSYLKSLENNAPDHAKEVGLLRQELTIIKSMVEERDASQKASIMEKAKFLYKNYSWAAKPLKDLFDLVAPGWSVF